MTRSLTAPNSIKREGATLWGAGLQKLKSSEERGVMPCLAFTKQKSAEAQMCNGTLSSLSSNAHEAAKQVDDIYRGNGPEEEPVAEKWGPVTTEKSVAIQDFDPVGGVCRDPVQVRRLVKIGSPFKLVKIDADIRGRQTPLNSSTNDVRQYVQQRGPIHNGVEVEVQRS
ncbi:hypothetical protein K438DRAFT_1765092 [Mycena galopus ATCC 62051]|nr:hypothetical protein K438DRAFT_1765092 [Mycena galopus ATCC 62051]